MHATRRRAARRESSERARFIIRDREVAGWTLNLSLGGIRAIVEEPVGLGEEIYVSVGDGQARPGRIVWIQEETDGAIVGVAYLDVATDEVVASGVIPVMRDDLEQSTEDGHELLASAPGSLTRRQQN